ncbi:PucR family transcriptional regulator [uncultured Dysosmobacter sp.]|uniref:PucR family transcriptional regulator n=1 Tax=uncultured Dysosmobacter sp. TaxID=2591384 RepID=UPI0026277567|nr:PucR family transcriptional regulator [uncultured Dysosmobacter sp.]
MYTLADFMKSSIVPEFHLLTQEKNFYEIPIESVSVQELPVDNFIQKNELVLTTALGCLEEPDRFRQLIFEVSRAKAAAMLLAFSDETYQVSEELIRYADSLSLPVFVIPWKYRFSEIQSETIRNIQNEKLKIYRDIQTALFNLYFESKSLDSAAELIAELFSVPIAIEDRNHQIQGASRNMRELLAAEPPEGLEPFHDAEILVGQIPAGYIRTCAASCGSGRMLPEDMGQGVLEKYICFPLSLWFNRKNIEDMVTVRLKNDFVWNLANKNYDSFDEFALQGMRLHFNLDKDYTCVILKVVPAEDDAAGVEYSGKAAEDAAEIEALLIETGRELHLEVMFADRSLQFTVYVENLGDRPADLLDQFVGRIDHRLTERFPIYHFFWGISEVGTNRESRSDFNRLYINASLALQYCLNANGRQYRFTYQDTKEAQVISALSNHPEIREAAEEIMAPLMKSSSGKELMHTLTEYIANNYNTSLTARKLHLHRQSLLYRLEKIQLLTGMDLAQHRDLFLLEIYSRIFSNY